MSDSAAADEFAQMNLSKESDANGHKEDRDREFNESSKNKDSNNNDIDQDALYSNNITRKYSTASTKTAPPIQPPENMPHHRGNQFGTANTGPKGVIADARSFEEARRREIQAKQQQQSENRVPDGTKNYLDFGAPTARSRLIDDDRMRQSLDANDDDDDIMQIWRKKRLQELKTGASIQAKKTPMKRKYGRLETVDALGYLDAIEKVPSDVIVVVTIYDDKSSESQFVEDCMGTLARRHVYTRFVKIHYSEAEMDPQVMPAVLAYKAGELIANMPRVVDEVPSNRELSTESLELILKKQNVIKSEKTSSSGTSLYDWDDDN